MARVTGRSGRAPKEAAMYLARVARTAAAEVRTVLRAGTPTHARQRQSCRDRRRDRRDRPAVRRPRAAARARGEADADHGPRECAALDSTQLVDPPGAAQATSASRDRHHHIRMRDEPGVSEASGPAG